MRIIFLGAPGAGKGTQAEMLSARLGIPTISTGAIIRAAIKSGTEMGVKAKQFIDNGELVADEVVIGIIQQRLAESDCVRGFILDGFPRTVPQAQALEQMGVAIDAVISIEVADDVIVQRMSGRRVCSSCGATYHTEHMPSKDGVHCDKCRGELIIRTDDEPSVVLSRLALYHETTEPLKDFYAERGILKLVESQERVEDTSKCTLRAIGVLDK